MKSKQWIAILSVLICSTAFAKEEEKTKKSILDLSEVEAPYPQWGFEASGSVQAFSDNRSLSQDRSSSIRAFSLQTEYQPIFFQRWGVLGIGPSFALYPAGGEFSSSVFSNWSFGAQIRYQAHFLQDQAIVPMAGYAFESWFYRLNNGNAGNVIAHGPLAGVWLLLNALSTESAQYFYLNYGISRSYLVLEAHLLSGSNSEVELKGPAFYFGLRIEM